LRRRVVFLLAALRAGAVLRFRVAAAFLPAALRFGDFLVVVLRAEVFRFLVAAAFLPAALLFGDLRAAVFRAELFLAVVFRLRVAAAFLAAVLRVAVFRLRVAAAFLAPVDLFLAGDMGHPLSVLRTPCASGVAVPVRSSLPTPRTARRDEGRS
jgi:hypothetical protein